MPKKNDDEWFKSKWGSDDQLGTLNLLNQDKVLETLKLVRTGKVIQLGHQMYNGMPGRHAFHGPFYYLISQRVYDNRPPFREPTKNGFGGALGRVEMSDHTGTHLDALNHISKDEKYYNGIDSHEVTGNTGTSKLGIDTSPAIVTRGVMVDVTKGANNIAERGKPISVKQVEEFLDAHFLDVVAGDAIFFYTGVSRLWDNSDQYNSYFESSPGIGMELAKWIASKGASVSGADVPSSEVVPAEKPGERLPVHQELITKNGIRLIDNIKLDELAKEKVYEFLFVCSPLRIKGGTASPVVPLAIF
ncbi:hypothetical protein IX51_09140 [uncultured archaeon]|nr:hypothetical protein IX51_09140 [uncultured archaeon]